MLGYTNGTITSYYDDTMDSTVYEWFGNDTDPGIIWMSGVQCDGTETSLVDCPFDGWGVGSCSSPAYVVCYNEDDSPMDVRLVIGRSDGYGSVEVYYNSIWGGLTYLRFWHNEAKVVCRMLGYSHGVSYGASDIPFTTIPLWRSRSCTGNETSLADCPFVMYHHGNRHTLSEGLGCGAALCYDDPQGMF
ncbi:CD5 antigen-like [Argopecten irradians]|uniref:CD5 antigen-like n=1 Tax=Argopecten irradians TaxID=31199 RepID=UPI003722B56C